MGRPRQFDEQTVLERAMNLFWEKGFQATSMQDLVAELGINRASLYTTFGDKEQLYQQSLEHYLASNGEHVQSLFQANNHDIKKGLKAWLLGSYKPEKNRLEPSGCFLVSATSEMSCFEEQGTLYELITANTENFIKGLTAYFEHGQESGQIGRDKDPVVLAKTTLTFYYGIQGMEKVITESEEVEKIVDEYLSSIG